MFIKMMQIAPYDSGKTFNALTFPKCFYVVTCEGEEITIFNYPQLKKNLVELVDLRPKNLMDLKRIYDIDNMRKAEFCVQMDRAKQLVKEGKVETLVIDNGTDLAMNVWMMIESFYPQYSDKKMDNEGKLKVDNRGMYGSLKSRLMRILVLEILNFPGNLVFNVQLGLEDEDTLRKMPESDRKNPYIPNMLGSIRHEIPTKFPLIVFLEKVGENKKYKFVARTDMGNSRKARTKYVNLPLIIENLNYDFIIKCIQEKVKG